MKKITIILIIVLLFSLVGCNSKENIIKQNQVENDIMEEKLTNYPLVQKKADKIINELFNTGYFENIKIDDYSISEKEIQINYDIVNEEIYESSLSITFDKKGNLKKIYLSNFTQLHDNKQLFSNQMLAITYLKDIDIKEQDFSNENEAHSYKTYIECMAGISKTYFVIADNREEELLINFSPSGNSLSISF